MKEFVPDLEMKRRAAQGEFGNLFIMVLFMIAKEMRGPWSLDR